MREGETREQWLKRMDAKIQARAEQAIDSERGIALVQLMQMLKDEMKATVMPGEVHEIKLVEIANVNGKIVEIQSA